MLKLITLSSSSKGNCHILETDNSSIMIDCGIDFKIIIDNIDIKKLDGVFITHRHGDHSKGAKDLSIYTNCNYYMNTESCEHLELYAERYKKEINGVIETKDFKIMPFEVYHDVQNTNFLILHKESGIKIVYITDTSNVSNIHFNDIDFFIVEGNFSLKWDLSDGKYIRTNSDYGHLPIEDTIEFLKENVNINSKGIFISHISRKFDNISEFENMVRDCVPDYVNVKALNNKTFIPQVYMLKNEIEIEF